MSTAGRAAGGRPSQDRVYALDRAVVVLDGASEPDPRPNDGGWYADQLGRRLAALLDEDPDQDLRECLAAAIGQVAGRYRLVPGVSPSCTATLLRWDGEYVDAAVLGDSPLVAFALGGVEVVSDDRLDDVLLDVTDAMTARLREGHGFDEGHAALVRAMDARLRAVRNSDGGYWICEADPSAAGHALTRRWRRRELSAVLAVTDGVSRGVDEYRRPASWPAALNLARAAGPTALIDTVHDAERDDPDGRRWPRTKRHDDKTVALVEFEPAPAADTVPAGPILGG